MDREDVRAIPCPTCNAEAWLPCVGKHGRERLSNHAERRSAAYRSVAPEQRVKKDETRGHVYFILSGRRPRATVKIGFTSGNPYSRKARLQTGNAQKLRLIAIMPGTYADERRLHNMFASQRVSGEWFKFCGPVEDWLVGAL